MPNWAHSNGSGVGPLTLSVTFDQNRNDGTRSADITVAGQDVTLFQAGASDQTGNNDLLASPTFLRFGDQRVTTLSDFQRITLTNSTLNAMTITGVILSETNGHSFLQANNCSTILPGSSCAVSVIFFPLIAGNRSASLTIQTGAGVAARTIPLIGTGILTGSFDIVNSRTGKVLDLQNGSTSAGTLINQNALNGLRQQQWQLVATGTGHYAIKNVVSGKVLDVAGGSSSNGALVQQYDSLGGSNQQWDIVAVDDVHYRIANLSSGKALDVTGGSTSDGALIQQWDYIGGGQQMWLRTESGSSNGSLCQFLTGISRS